MQDALVKKKAEWLNYSVQHHDPNRKKHLSALLSQISVRIQSKSLKITHSFCRESIEIEIK